MSRRRPHSRDRYYYRQRPNWWVRFMFLRWVVRIVVGSVVAYVAVTGLERTISHFLD